MCIMILMVLTVDIIDVVFLHAITTLVSLGLTLAHVVSGVLGVIDARGAILTFSVWQDCVDLSTIAKKQSQNIA